jgi:hypothetical protein
MQSMHARECDVGVALGYVYQPVHVHMFSKLDFQLALNVFTLFNQHLADCRYTHDWDERNDIDGMIDEEDVKT